MRPLAVHHVSVNVDDVETARRFYVEVLGFAERDDRPELGIDGAWLDAGGEQLHLVEGPVPDTPGPHFAVLVADLDAAIAELRDAGVQVSDPVPIGRARQSFLRDPCGNLVELHQRD